MTIIHDYLEWNIKEPLHIIEYDDGNYKLPPVIYEKVKHLKLKREEFLKSLTLPPKVQYLRIHTHKWIKVFGFIPKTITHLQIKKDKNFKKEIDIIYIPSTVQHLYIEECLVKSVQIIPEEQYYSITPLKSQLKKLSLPYVYSYLLTPNSFPSTLEEYSGNFTIDPNLLPPSITSLHHSIYRQGPIDPKITSLSLYGYKEDFNLSHENETKNIRELSVSCNSFKTTQMKGVKKLKYSSSSNYLLDLMYAFPSLEELLLDGNLKFGIPNVIKLSLIGQFNPDIVIPQTVQSLKIDLSFSLPTKLPSSIKELTFSFKRNKHRLLLLKKETTNIRSDNNNRKNINNDKTDMFLFIWRQKFLNDRIIEHLINPNGTFHQVALKFKNSSSVNIMDEGDLKKLKQQQNIDKNFKFKISSQLLGTSKIPLKIVKQMDQKTCIYFGQGLIPRGTKVVVWRIDSVIPVNFIPKGVSSIIFGSEFNQIIIKDSIPKSVLSIHFGHSFQQDLKYINFPTNLQYLYFGECFNQKIRPERLPSTLRHIGFKNISNIESDLGCLPSKIDHLYLDIGGDIDLSSLPFIKHIKLSNRYRLAKVPDTVKSVITKDKSDLNKKLFKISNSQERKEHKKESIKLVKEKLCPSIAIHLTLDDNKFIAPHLFDKLNIKSIVTNNFKQILFPGCIPDTVETFKFDRSNSDYIQTIPNGVFPPSIKSISFSKSFNQPLSLEFLPRSLTELDVGWAFNQTILKNTLPESLKILEFGCSFKKEFEKDTLPHSLVKLSIHSGFYYPTLIECIPNSVTDFSFGRDLVEPLHFPIEKLSTTSITKLWLGDKVIIDSPKLIPSNIKEIRLGYCNKVEPVPLTLESLSYVYDYPINGLIN